MWLEVGETEDCMAEAMYQAPGCGCRRGRRDRRLNGGGNVSGAMMWLHVGEDRG